MAELTGFLEWIAPTTRAMRPALSSLSQALARSSFARSNASQTFSSPGDPKARRIGDPSDLPLLRKAPAVPSLLPVAVQAPVSSAGLV